MGSVIDDTGNGDETEWTSLTWPLLAKCILHIVGRMLCTEGRKAGQASAHRFVFNGHVLHVPSRRREILRSAQNDHALR